jgi:heat shock protein HslJ
VELAGPRLTLAAGGTRIELVDREVAEPDLPLERTLWRLETIVRGGVASSVPAGLEATLRLEDGRIGGFNGCNEWGARLVSSEGGVLEIRGLAQTAIRCSGAAAALERDVNAVVAAGRIAYAIDGSRLVLRAGGRELHLRAEAEPSA